MYSAIISLPLKPTQRPLRNWALAHDMKHSEIVPSFFHREDTLSRMFRNVRCQSKQRHIPTGCIHCHEHPNTYVLCSSFHSCCTNSLAVRVLNQQHTPQFILDLMVLWSFYEAVVLRQNITQLLLCGIKLWAVPNLMNCFATSRWMHTSLAANTINNVPSAEIQMASVTYSTASGRLLPRTSWRVRSLFYDRIFEWRRRQKIWMEATVT
jgi:hypothetical protein